MKIDFYEKQSAYTIGWREYLEMIAFNYIFVGQVFALKPSTFGVHGAPFISRTKDSLVIVKTFFLRGGNIKHLSIHSQKLLDIRQDLNYLKWASPEYGLLNISKTILYSF